MYVIIFLHDVINKTRSAFFLQHAAKWVLMGVQLWWVITAFYPYMVVFAQNISKMYAVKLTQARFS